MKYKIKQAWKSIKIYTSLPHIWVFGIILILSIIACICSVIYMKTNTFLSSIFANIFIIFFEVVFLASGVLTSYSFSPLLFMQI